MLKFLESSRTVYVGEKSVRLSPKQFGLLRHVHEHGTTDFDDLQDVVWPCVSESRVVTHGAFRALCAKVNAKLFDSGIHFELTTRSSLVAIRKVG
jgi:hypothetical protein